MIVMIVTVVMIYGLGSVIINNQIIVKQKASLSTTTDKLAFSVLKLIINAFSFWTLNID